jgi:RNA polymerase sigma-70 factor (ECF subfamily)
MTQNRLRLVNDRELVVGAVLGSMEAYDELVRRYRGGVLLVATQALGCERAEDVAQEVFLHAFRELPQLRDPDKFPAWLHTIARNRARRIAKRDCRNTPTDITLLDNLITEQSQEIAPNPADEVMRAEACATIRAFLNDLAPELQSVLYLYYYEQWPAARIAEFLSLSLTTVKWRLHTGRQQLGRRLSRLTEEMENV